MSSSESSKPPQLRSWATVVMGGIPKRQQPQPVVATSNQARTRTSTPSSLPLPVSMDRNADAFRVSDFPALQPAGGHNRSSVAASRAFNEVKLAVGHVEGQDGMRVNGFQQDPQSGCLRGSVFRAPQIAFNHSYLAQTLPQFNAELQSQAVPDLCASDFPALQPAGAAHRPLHRAALCQDQVATPSLREFHPPQAPHSQSNSVTSQEVPRFNEFRSRNQRQFNSQPVPTPPIAVVRLPPPPPARMQGNVPRKWQPPPQTAQQSPAVPQPSYQLPPQQLIQPIPQQEQQSVLMQPPGYDGSLVQLWPPLRPPRFAKKPLEASPTVSIKAELDPEEILQLDVAHLSDSVRELQFLGPPLEPLPEELPTALPPAPDLIIVAPPTPPTPPSPPPQQFQLPPPAPTPFEQAAPHPPPLQLPLPQPQPQQQPPIAFVRAMVPVYYHVAMPMPLPMPMQHQMHPSFMPSPAPPPPSLQSQLPIEEQQPVTQSNVYEQPAAPSWRMDEPTNHLPLNTEPIEAPPHFVPDAYAPALGRDHAMEFSSIAYPPPPVQQPSVYAPYQPTGFPSPMAYPPPGFPSQQQLQQQFQHQHQPAPAYFEPQQHQNMDMSMTSPRPQLEQQQLAQQERLVPQEQLEPQEQLDYVNYQAPPNFNELSVNAEQRYARVSPRSDPHGGAAAFSHSTSTLAPPCFYGAEPATTWQTLANTPQVWDPLSTNRRGWDPTYPMPAPPPGFEHLDPCGERDERGRLISSYMPTEGKRSLSTRARKLMGEQVKVVPHTDYPTPAPMAGPEQQLKEQHHFIAMYDNHLTSPLSQLTVTNGATGDGYYVSPAGPKQVRKLNTGLVQREHRSIFEPGVTYWDLLGRPRKDGNRQGSDSSNSSAEPNAEGKEELKTEAEELLAESTEQQPTEQQKIPTPLGEQQPIEAIAAAAAAADDGDCGELSRASNAAVTSSTAAPHPNPKRTVSAEAVSLVLAGINEHLSKLLQSSLNSLGPHARP